MVKGIREIARRGYENHDVEPRNDHEKMLKAVFENDITECEAMLADGSVNANDSVHGFTPLFVACQEGHAVLAKMLVLQYHADVNYAEVGAAPPIHVAVYRGHSTLKQFLLEQGASPHVVAHTLRFYCGLPEKFRVR